MSTLELTSPTKVKTRAAAFSILSNSALIALKFAAGLITGSIAIITDAVQSSIDLVASVVTYFSVRKADQPADDDHRYGHAKVENLAAAIEGMLILVGGAVVIYEAAQRLTDPAKVENLPVGIAVIAASGVANGLVSTYLYRRAAETDSPALAGDATHLRTDAWLSLGVLVALVLVQVTGIEEIDAIAALLLALAILWAGVRLVRSSSRILVDESLPREELEAVREAVEGHGAREIAGFHKLRTRRAGSRRYIDMHVQFRSGTSLDRAHEVSHELQRQIGQRIRDADVLIHLEPDRGGEGGRPSRPGLPTGD